MTQGNRSGSDSQSLAGEEAGRARMAVCAGAAGCRTWAQCSSEGEEAPQQQLSERPGVWSVPHQWGVQLWLRMKARERERIKGSQGLL